MMWTISNLQKELALRKTQPVSIPLFCVLRANERGWNCGGLRCSYRLRLIFLQCQSFHFMIWSIFNLSMAGREWNLWKCWKFSEHRWFVVTSYFFVTSIISIQQMFFFYGIKTWILKSTGFGHFPSLFVLHWYWHTTIAIIIAIIITIITMPLAPELVTLSKLPYGYLTVMVKL